VLREAIAAVLGVAVGLLLVAYPAAIVRIHTAGRVPDGRHGDYGTDGAPPATWLWLVRAIGAVAILVALFIGYRLLA
jgi:hypothetical protein